MIRSICHIPMMPMRSEARHGSEMVSMLLFSESFFVLESKDVWHKVRCEYDNYEGWIRTGKVIEPDAAFWKSYDEEKPVYAEKLLTAKENLLLSPGCRLPLFDGNKFSSFYREYELNSIEKLSSSSIQERIKESAITFLNTPYLWGGRSIFGIDCSGLTQIVFKINDIKLPRDAWQQAERGETISSLDKTKCGDLAFFSEGGDKITHVGILLGDGTIIHASDFLRIDRIDENGIYNTFLEKYTLKPVLIKRNFTP